jgi:Ca-activated chloride channel homolog
MPILPFLRLALLLALLPMLAGLRAVGQIPPQQLPEKTRILFLLDGSGSMLAPWERTTRIAVAKKLLTDLVDSLEGRKNLELALRVYGHQYERRLQRCDDSRLEVPFAPRNHEQIRNRLRSIGPKGNTPIAYSLEQAARDFPEGDAARNIVIILTDGIESCLGDPCAISLALQRRGIFLKPFIIGIGMEQDFRAAFGCMGEYFDARNIRDLKQALDAALFQSLGRTTITVDLLDAQGRPGETNVNVTFLNNFTGTAAFDFVHYRDERGRPDTVEVDPVIDYDLKVNTVPPVVQKNVAIVPGSHNHIALRAPQGLLSVAMPGHTEYADGVPVLVRTPENGATIAHFRLPGEMLLLEGRYDLEILCRPKIQLLGIAVEKGKPNRIELPQPGIVNFVSTALGIGSLYQIDADGASVWVRNLDNARLRQTLALQPGRYKAVFRSAEAKGSKFTLIRHFNLEPGASLTVQFSR